jgi:two-component system cell cycle sensor histidine kinase/response regulator CckA
MRATTSTDKLTITIPTRVNGHEKTTDAKLRTSEIRYRRLFEAAKDGILILDAVTLKINDVNPFMTELLGYSHKEFLGKELWEIGFFSDRNASRDAFRELQVKRYLRYDDLPLRTRDGSVREVEFVSNVYEENGPQVIQCNIRDITERKQVEGDLRDSEERYRDLVENAIDMIYTHDLDGNYLSVNKAVEKITGYSREEALTMNLAQSVAPEYLATARQMIAARLAGTEVTAYELEIIAKDGHRVVIEVNTRIIYENGAPIGMQGIARDISKRKQLEDQFRQSQKMEAIGVLAGGIAHDFNNMLTVINGYSDLTLKNMSLEDPLRHNIEEVKDAGDRAAMLTGQLLVFSRKQVLKPSVHNLSTAILNIEKMLRRIIRESIEFRMVLDPNLGNIKADPGQIEQVIMNLAINARDAMPDGGTLTIETQNVCLDEGYVSQHIEIAPGPFVKMTVTDTGEGMNEETQRRVFEPFFTTKDLGRGTGLGLSTVYAIIKQSGGDIMVYSEVGHGTTFKIYLPCVDEVVQKPRSAGDSEEILSGTETILLVEDEEIVRNLVSTILTGYGYNVLVAVNGRAAQSKCETYSEPIHMLLTDVIMPKMSGSELKEQVVKLRPDIKVLFMSGYTDDAISHRGILDAGAAFIEKPFSPDDLARKVCEVLGR